MRKASIVLVVLGSLLLALALFFSACGDSGEGDDVLVGLWTDEQGLVEYEFTREGALLVRFMGEEDQTTYSAADGRLTFPDPDTGEQSEIQYRLEGDKLILSFDGEEGVLVRKE